MTAQSTMRRNDGTISHALRALCQGDLQDQNLFLISIEAIRDSLGDRWSAKREMVWGQVEKFLHHEFRDQDLVLRLDEVNALVAQPGRTRLAAQNRGVKAAHDLMRFFLGDAHDAPITVKMVSAIAGDEVICSNVPADEVAAAMTAQEAARYRPTPVVRCPILTPIGRHLYIDLSLAPILSLQACRHGAGFAGHHVRTALGDIDSGRPLDALDHAQLPSSDLVRVDLMVLATAFAQRRELTHEASPLVVPVSAHTLAQSSARYAFLEALRRLPAAERQSMAIEIVDLEPGAPESRVCDLVAIARPHCRGVICQLEVSVANAEKLRLAGATMSALPEREPPTEMILLRQEGAFAAALKIIPALMLHHIPPHLTPAAALAGATHCSLVGEPAPLPTTRVEATGSQPP